MKEEHRELLGVLVPLEASNSEMLLRKVSHFKESSHFDHKSYS